MSRRIYNGLDLQDQRIIRVGTPRDATDAVNRAYIDDLITGQSWKRHVRVASIEDVTVLLPGSIIDGVTLTSGDRVLLKDQSDPTENGIYSFVSHSSPLERSIDANTSSNLIPSSTVYTVEGDTNADTAWTMITDAPIVLGTTEMTWVRFGGSSEYQAGDGLVREGTEFSVAVGEGLTVDDTITIDHTVVARKFTTAIGDGANTVFAVEHGLSNRDVTVSVYRTDTGEEVAPDVSRYNDSTVVVVFRDPPSTDFYTVTVVG